MMHDGLFHNANYAAIGLVRRQANIMVSLYHPWVVKDEVTFDDMKKVDRIRFDIGHDTQDNPYTSYPCKTDIIVDNYATMLSELSMGKGYVIVSPDITEQEMSYQTKEIPLPGEPLYISLSLLYKKNEDRKEVLEIIDKICDTFE